MAVDYGSGTNFVDYGLHDYYFQRSSSYLLYYCDSLCSHFGTWHIKRLCFRYLGRKRLEYVVESAVQGTETLVKPGYSYWTLAYMLSKTGARKLLQGRPLSKMMAVDEYLCIMFDQHPRFVSHFTGILSSMIDV